MSDPPSLTKRLSEFRPFSRSKSSKVDDEDQGEAVDFKTLAGGGHSARQTTITKHALRVSDAMKEYLSVNGILGSTNETLQDLLQRPHIEVPASVTDRSHRLPEYFISSSHNTYLMAHQLYGESSASAYETALSAGSRCVEIDAWDNDDDKDEPKVTHGYTLVSNIPFRTVCEKIRDVVDKEAAQAVNAQGYRAAPIFLSLENHCGAHGQLRLVQIMEEIWGSRLLSKEVREKGHSEQAGGDHVTLAELGSKICVIVEHHIPNEAPASDDEDSAADDSEPEDEKRARHEYSEKKKAAPDTIIIPELAALGVYAQSVKPSDNTWFESELKNAPHHHLINVSEAGLGTHMPSENAKIARHNAHRLMRVYPKGTRISSANLRPVSFWGVGAQICALNWQTFGAPMQLNEALFSGSDGFVLKPAALRAGGDGVLNTGRRVKLRLHVAGATDVPVPEGRDGGDVKPYVTCTLLHPDDLKGEPPKKKTDGYKQHKLGIIHKGATSPPTDPVWDDVLEWEYEENEMVFLRILIKSDDAWASNPKLAATAVRLAYTTDKWVFIRMLDLKGRETTCTLLVRFEIVEV